MTKQDLLNQLSHIDRNARLSFCFSSILANKKTPIDVANVQIGELTIQCSDLFVNASDKENIHTVIDEYTKSSLRTLVREMTEKIRGYTNATGQYHLIEYNDTFNYSRILRNSFSHEYVISFKGYKEKILTKRDIWWRGKCFTISMEGSVLDKTIFGYQDAFLLSYDLQELSQHTLR